MNPYAHTTAAAMASPALSVCTNFSDMDDEELDLYLAGCVPLSNLPTPPPAKQPPLHQSTDHFSHPQSTMAASALPALHADGHLASRRPSPELEVYALRLASLLPGNLSGQKASVSAIEGFLERACLPVDMVAFASCVLDALSEDFSRRWRDAFLPMDAARLDFYLGPDCWQAPTMSLDLVVLAALALAHGFIDDRGRSNKHWAMIEAAGRFTTKEVDQTKRCILEDLDYGLFRISDERVECTVREMQHAAYFVSPRTSGAWDAEDGDRLSKDGRPSRLSLSTGSGGAVWLHGVQTPEPSP